MRPTYIALIFWILAACAVFGIINSRRTGVAIDTFTYRRDENPSIFTIVILGNVFVIGLSIAETLYALGLTGDPLVVLRSLLSIFPYHAESI
jgi:hypothetical protein